MDVFFRDHGYRINDSFGYHSIAARESYVATKYTREFSLYYDDRKCQQRLIDVFVNSNYVKTDKLVINFNYEGGNTVINFPKFKAADDNGVFGCNAFVSG